jgi:hypothetical protein
VAAEFHFLRKKMHKPFQLEIFENAELKKNWLNAEMRCLMLPVRLLLSKLSGLCVVSFLRFFLLFY